MPHADTFGPFDLLAPLAKGGMAETHLARRTGAAPGEELVVKRVLPELADDPELQALFDAEAKVAARLRHRNVVRTLGAGEVSGTSYLGLEYIWGEDLRNVARQAQRSGTALPRALAARIAAGAARGLHHAHELAAPDGAPMGLVHRDVSPPNIMVAFDGRPVMIDFGVAVVAQRFQRPRAGQLKGKFAYMSPEQVQGLAVDRRSDVFALGVILYEFTVGRRLFRASSDMATAAAIAAADVPPPTSVDPNYPSALEAIVLRALARAPEDRFPTADAFADALEEWLGDAPEHQEAAVGAWMKETFTERVAEIATLVGDPEYGGPSVVPALPSPEASPPPVEAASMTDPTPSEPTPASSKEPKSAPVADVDPADDPFMRSQRTSKAIFAAVGVVLAAALAYGGFQFSQHGLGTSHFDDYDAGPSREDFDAGEYVPPPPPPRVAVQVRSTPAGAAIIVNGASAHAVTPAEVELVEGARNVVSLHSDGHDTVFLESDGRAPIDATLPLLPTPAEPEVEEAIEPAAEEGSAEPADPGPGVGRGRLRVRALGTDGSPIEAEVLVNGRSVGSAPVTVDVDANVRHHVTARMAGMRDSAAYVRPIEWTNVNSELEVLLELTAEGGATNRWTTLRLRTSPQDATVTVDGERVGSVGLTNLPVPGHHVIEITAPDHTGLVRSVDGTLGQITLDAVLDVVRTEPSALTLTVEPADTTVYVERIRHGSPGARQLRFPVEAESLESGPYNVTLERRADGERVRGRFELTFEPGTHRTLHFLLGEDGEFAIATDTTEPAVAAP